jgi:hypothetical protein
LRSKLLLAAVVAAVLLTVPLGAGAGTSAAPTLKGIYDENQLLYGNPDKAFAELVRLRTKVVRVTLLWGGRGGVARRKPARASDPADPAYRWAVYDRLVRYAGRNKIKVMFSIWGTPRWANGGKAQRVAPRRALDLRNFAAAAARRYSGRYEVGEGEETETLPKAHFWLAWNEPNNPVFLSPQFRRVGRRYVIQSARDYARICNAVVAGVHGARAGQKVACGVTGPRGNNEARGPRPSASPLYFVQAMKRAGARGFDAYAHHPYYGRPSESPRSRPPARTAITLGNMDVLIREVTRLYGRKPIWITEYGYQTNPPDRIFGVSPKRQAQYMAQSFAIARRNPRIQMFIWFLLRDERGVARWQSGLVWAGGRKKPAYNVFRRLG